MVEWTVMQTELRYFFRDPRTAKWVPLALFAAILGLWPYLGSSYVTVAAVTFIGLEPQYVNYLHRWPGHFAGHALLPISWDRIIRGKNLATILETALAFGVVSILTLFVTPDRPSWTESGHAVLYLAMTVPLLLIAGNALTGREARTGAGVEFGDAAAALQMMVAALFCSLPFVVLVYALQLTWAAVLFAVLALFMWARFSIPHTARFVQQHTPVLCRTP
jgi:hypothetical protein